MPRLAGIRRATRALSLANGRRESPLESRSFVFFDDVGLPSPEPQAWIEDEDGFLVARVDALWRDHRAIGECDGAVKYDIDAAPTTLLAEKRRQERLEDLGYIVVRWDHADLTHHAAATKQRILRAVLTYYDDEFSRPADAVPLPRRDHPRHDPLRVG